MLLKTVYCEIYYFASKNCPKNNSLPYTRFRCSQYIFIVRILYISLCPLIPSPVILHRPVLQNISHMRAESRAFYDWS